MSEESRDERRARAILEQNRAARVASQRHIGTLRAEREHWQRRIRAITRRLRQAGVSLDDES